ncbi:unnamed protein product, partial [Meganyctiphanes norvegica]
CEVSAEAPAFQTAAKVVQIKVIEPPGGPPVISGAVTSHEVHDEVALNCTSPPSQPPAQLTFYINHQKADESWVIEYPHSEPHRGAVGSVLGLQFLLRPRLLQQGYLIVRCTASISNLYWKTAHKVIYGDPPQHALMVEPRPSGGSSRPRMCQLLCFLQPLLMAALLFLVKMQTT